MEIEYGIPIPPRPRNGNGKKYNFDRMEVNSSFALEGANAASKLTSASKAFKRRTGVAWEFTVRSERDAEGNIIRARIWRVQ